MKTQFTCLILLWISISVAVAQDSIPVADCDPPKSSTYLDINNVRAMIHSGGDMWWDLQGDPEYEIPKGSGKHSSFAGSFLIGAKDQNDHIHVMAQQFRQYGVSAYPGPVISGGTDAGTTRADVCREYDKLYKINKSQVKKFRDWYACSQNPDCNTEENFPGYTIPDIILNWPAHGPQGGYAYYLAPFWDANNDGEYNPYNGDFPYFEFPEDSITDNYNCIDSRDNDPRLHGDQAIWYVYNDVGNGNPDYDGPHNPLGVEVQAQAFAFQTNGVLNNQTFYRYDVINRSTNHYHDMYFGFWTDADIGGAMDDLIGCDVSRGLGYAYNGDDYDDDYEGNPGYGENPPAFGIDVIGGPFQNNDGVDNESNWVLVDGTRQLDCSAADVMNGNINGQNFDDGVVDNERWGLTGFMYHYPTMGCCPWLTRPSTALAYYYYLTNRWKDGTHLIYGGNGYPSSPDGNIEASFLYPGSPTTDPCGYGVNEADVPGWSEETEGNPPDDRRFYTYTGPVSMQPGEVNNLTMAALWARSYSGSAFASVEALQQVSDAVQEKFDRCFRELEGPDDPELEIVELNGKLVFHIMNDQSSNNYIESYKEKDEDMQADGCNPYYKFQGYQVFQLKDADVDFESDRYDTTKVREIFQCDIRDNTEDLVNYLLNPDNAELYSRTEVRASNNGIAHSFEITTDAFPWGDSDALVNHKTMYFVAKAYAANTDCLFDPTNPQTSEYQKETYLTSRGESTVYTATAHKTEPESGGTGLNSDYGSGVEITQIAGFGNGNNVLNLRPESIDTIMSAYPWCDSTPDYRNGAGPVNIRIVDPLSVTQDDYSLYITHADETYYGKLETGFDWVLINSAGDSIWSDQSITMNNFEQIIPDAGISIAMKQVGVAAYKNENHYQNGFLDASIESNGESWLSFLPDTDHLDYYNWIRSGTYQNNELWDPNTNYDDYIGKDDNQDFENVLGGTWAPAYLASTFKYGPVYNRSQMSLDKYAPLSSVDIVITSDKSKWSRCVVLEMNENNWTLDEYGYETPVTPLTNDDSEGNALRFDLRTAASVDKDGDPDGSGTHGMGWFPGYAIDVRTGERLNIIFGEDSGLPAHNGSDMMWNPTSGVEEDGEIIFGGKHYIWVMGHTNYVLNPEISAPPYDSCQFIYDYMMEYENSGSLLAKKHALTGMMWTAIPYLQDGGELLSSDIRIRLRTGSPYFRAVEEFPVPDSVNNNYPAYRFSTDGLVPEFDQPEVAKSALDLIRVVPNPYYGHSYYESSGTRRVKITNLPESCTVSIFDVSGHLVRRFDKTGGNPWLEWDLTDRYGKPIGGGVYIVHISAPGIGEKVVKWFGALSER
jgi:hypothetical protein